MKLNFVLVTFEVYDIIESLLLSVNYYMNAIQYVVWGRGGGGGVLLVMRLDSRCVR